MRFEQILADCIEALDQGVTIEGCLARYPQHAEQLRPMLLLVADLRGQPKAHLSAKAFTQIRATLATNAQKASGGHAAATETSSLPVPTRNGRYDQAMLHQAGHRRGRVAQAQRQPGRPHRHYTLATDQPPAANRQGRRHLLRTLSMGLALCLLVGLVIFVRQMALSLPGTALYGVKRAGEQVQGIFMTAAGDGAQWHAQQATLRMGELAQLPAGDGTQQANLAQAAATQVEAALAAGAVLPAAERVAFLLAWQAELQQLDATLPANAPAAAPARETVQTALAAVALALTPAPTLLPTVSEPTPLAMTPVLLATQGTTVALSATVTLTPALPVATPTLLIVPTVVLTATVTPTPTLTLTVTPTPVLIPTATASMTVLPTVAPTATPLPVMTQGIGLEESSNNEQDANPQDQGDAPSEGDRSGSTQDTSPDGQNSGDATATSVPVGTADASAPLPTAESLTPVATADEVLIFTPTPTTPAAATTSAQTPLPFLTPGLTQQPTLIVPEASTRVATPVEQHPTAQSTVSNEPATAVPTDAETSEPNNGRKATATPEPTRTSKPTATNAANDATPTRRRTPEPTAQPTAAAEPTESDKP